MHPFLTILDLGPQKVAISSYGVSLCFALAIAATGTLRAGRRAGCDVGACIALFGLALGAGFGGALLLHGAVQAFRFGSLATALQQPGLASFGALLGVAVAVGWGSHKLGLPALALTDRALPWLTAAQAVGRIGCLLGGCCYGRTWDGPLAVPIHEHARHPVPLYEATALILFTLACALRRDPAPGSGRRTRTIVLSYCALRLVLECLRADEVRGVLSGVGSAAQWIAGVVLAIGLARSAAPGVARASRRVLRKLWPVGIVALPLIVAYRAAADRSERLVFVGPDRVRVRDGWFDMGSDAADIDFAVALCNQFEPGAGCRPEQFADEQPRHRIYVSSFRIDRTEVSRAAYQRCVQAGACVPPHGEASPERGRDLPITSVAAADAQRYCTWLGGSLPSEAQWERAARGDDDRRFPWGREWNSRVANHGAGRLRKRLLAHRPAPFAAVSALPDGASVFGVVQLSGNVWELTADRYDAAYYARSERIDPRGGDGSAYVMRGGSSRSPAYTLRVTQRAGIKPDEERPDVGFRCTYASR